MATVLVQGPEGDRWVETGKAIRLQPGERLAKVGGKLVIKKHEEADLKIAVAREGIQWGDAVAKLTKVFGIKPCAPCERRRKILNEARKLGLSETLKKLKETL